MGYTRKDIEKHFIDIFYKRESMLFYGNAFDKALKEEGQEFIKKKEQYPEVIPSNTFDMTKKEEMKFNKSPGLREQPKRQPIYHVTTLPYQAASIKLQGYYQDVVQKLDKDFYDEFEHWVIDPSSLFWTWLRRTFAKDYSPSYAAELIIRAFYLYAPKEILLRSLLPSMWRLERKGEFFHIYANNSAPAFVGDYREAEKFLYNANSSQS